MVRSYIIRQFL